VEHIAQDKSGRVKFTFEMEINNEMMTLVKEDINMMTDLAVQGANAMRSQMMDRRKQWQGEKGQMQGHGMFMHGQ
jgi:hypothetical protein